ncbi:MAG: molybdopterin-dependent oxidoreductase, partial [Pirellulaceae bacterium]
MLVVQDIFPSPLSMRADFLLAGAAFTERDGCFVNHSGLVQAFKAATRPVGDARADGRILFELTERKGLFNALQIRKELAAAIPGFRGLVEGDLG